MPRWLGAIAHSALPIPVLTSLTDILDTIITVTPPSRELENFASRSEVKLTRYEDLEFRQFDLILMIECPMIIPAHDLQQTKWLNLHSGVLPRWRGHSANSWALLNDESTLGFTLHEATADVDGGPILAKYLAVNDGIQRYSELREKLLVQVSNEILRHLEMFVNDNLSCTAGPSDEENQHLYCSKLQAADGVLYHFSDQTRWFHNLSRLFTRATGSDLYLRSGDQYLRIDEITDTGSRYIGLTNSVLRQEGKRFEVKTLDGSIWVTLANKDVSLSTFRQMLSPNHR